MPPRAFSLKEVVGVIEPAESAFEQRARGPLFASCRAPRRARPQRPTSNAARGTEGLARSRN